MDAVDQAVSLSTAKTHLAGLVQAAETGEVVHISRHGKPVAVLISEQATGAVCVRGAMSRSLRGGPFGGDLFQSPK